MTTFNGLQKKLAGYVPAGWNRSDPPWALDA